MVACSKLTKAVLLMALLVGNLLPLGVSAQTDPNCNKVCGATYAVTLYQRLGCIRGTCYVTACSNRYFGPGNSGNLCNFGPINDNCEIWLCYRN